MVYLKIKKIKIAKVISKSNLTNPFTIIYHRILVAENIKFQIKPPASSIFVFWFGIWVIGRVCGRAHDSSCLFPVSATWDTLLERCARMLFHIVR